MKIILIDNNDKNYAVTKRVISELDFLYTEELHLHHFRKIDKSLKEEILDNDSKKIYMINIKLAYSSNGFNLVKFIRKNDLKNEIILLKDGNAILEKEYQNLINIFATIDTDSRFNTYLKSNLDLIMQNNCDKGLFTYKSRNKNLNIFYERILYVYRDTSERKVVVVTDNNRYPINIDLKDTVCLLDKRFKQVHRACIVNTLRAEMFDWNNSKIVLDNGKEVNYLSKKFKPVIDAPL